MDIKRLLKLVTSGCILILATRAHALSYTAANFTYPDPRGGNTEAYGINDNGVAAGWYSVHHVTEGYGFTYNADSFTTLSAPDSSGAYGGTFATAVNNNGAVVGHYHSTVLNKDIGFSFNGSTYTPIDASSLNFNQATITNASAVNDSGQIVGNYTDYATGTTHGFLYNGSYLSMVVAPGATVTTANGINNSGLIVGSVFDSANHNHGFIFNGNTFSIFNAPNSTDTFFQSISNNGQILGRYSDATGSHNFVLNNGVYESIDLSQLNASNIMLYGINNSGQIVGTAYGGPAGSYGFVLTPVPIPAAAWLFGSGLIGLAGFRGRSKVSHRITFD